MRNCNKVIPTLNILRNQILSKILWSKNKSKWLYFNQISCELKILEISRKQRILKHEIYIYCQIMLLHQSLPSFHENQYNNSLPHVSSWECLATVLLRMYWKEPKPSEDSNLNFFQEFKEISRCISKLICIGIRLYLLSFSFYQCHSLFSGNFA